MGLRVRLATAQLDAWEAVPGESRWVDYGCRQDAGELVVYMHTFRRVRERFDRSRDVLLWKPATTKAARRYAAGAWVEVLDLTQEWPPAEVEHVPRRRRDPRALEERAERRRT